MTHRLQVRVDRQITPRPGRNITRKWVYERSFSVHILTQDSLNSHWASNRLLVPGLGIFEYCWPAVESFYVCLHLVWHLTPVLFRLQHFAYSQEWAVDTENHLFYELRVAYFPDYLRASSTLMAELLPCAMNVVLLLECVFRAKMIGKCSVFVSWIQNKRNVGWKLWSINVISMWNRDALTHDSFFFAGQQSQQPQDYTKAWEEYYKKQGGCRGYMKFREHLNVIVPSVKV